MSRKGISKQQIFQETKEIVFSNQIPTAFKIRAKLKTGSIATIQKYLQEWKMDCFKNDFLHKELNLTKYNNSELAEKNSTLEQELNKQLSKNEHYAQELIYTEKANIELKEEKHQLNFTNQKLQLKLSAAEKTNNALEHVTQKIQNELNLNTNETIQKMQQIIDGLRLELKTVNETSIIALRETSNQGHEALMQEKVTSINLQAKIDSLTKELLESKKQFNEAIKIAKVQIRTLSRQNEQLQKIIQEQNLDKSTQLEEGSSVQFSKGVVAYGK